MRNPFAQRARTGQPDMDAVLREHTSGVLNDLAAAIEATAPAKCDHNVRKSCPICQTRRQAFADAHLVRAAGEAAS